MAVDGGDLKPLTEMRMSGRPTGQVSEVLSMASMVETCIEMFSLLTFGRY